MGEHPLGETPPPYIQNLFSSWIILEIHPLLSSSWSPNFSGVSSIVTAPVNRITKGKISYKQTSIANWAGGNEDSYCLHCFQTILIVLRSLNSLEQLSITINLSVGFLSLPTWVLCWRKRPAAVPSKCFSINSFFPASSLGYSLRFCSHHQIQS